MRKGDKFGKSEHYDDFRVFENHLYWQGKKIKTEGWSRSDKLALLGLFLTFFTAIFIAFLVNLKQIRENVCFFSYLNKKDFCVDLLNDEKEKT